MIDYQDAVIEEHTDEECVVEELEAPQPALTQGGLAS